MINDNKSRRKTTFLVQFALLLAIEALFCFTPLGSIPIGPLVATLAAVPVIITAIVMGPGAGALMGFAAGTFSFIVWTFMPPSPLAFVFTPFYSIGDISGNYWSLVICFVPRILIGFVAGITYRLFSRILKSKALPYLLSGSLGSLTNTFGVLGGIYLFFGRDYAAFLDKAYEYLLGFLGMIVLTNGIPEAIIGAIAAAAICPPLQKSLKRQGI
ncbi:MAG: ECF transporter S component [Anaerovoracaceae bacterium]|jgi:uncharacterized membrane protein